MLKKKDFGNIILRSGLISLVLSIPLWAAQQSNAVARTVQTGEKVLATGISNAGGYIGMGLSMGLAAIGAGIAVGFVGAAIVGVVSEKPESLGKMLIFLGIAEGIAIYGLMFAIMILVKTH
ncbi:MAG: ATP synthase subunit C [Candidatus Omnitrophica bacterium]|nr:ATP synthase subunit C [Candidatus Omnitrophota bacterium]